MKRLLFFSFMLLKLATISAFHAPQVTSIQPFGILYCRVGEHMFVDLDDYIVGYNVTHELVDPPSFAFIHPKISKVSTMTLTTPISPPPKVIAQFMPRDRLGYVNVSEPLLLLTDDLRVYYGNATFDPDIKSIDTFFEITDVNDTICFDVTYIEGRIIVDCLVNYEGHQINQFYIFNFSNLSDYSATPSLVYCNTIVTDRTKRGVKAFKFANESIYVYRYQEKSASYECESGGIVEIWRLGSGHDITFFRSISEISSGVQLQLMGFELFLGELFLLSETGYVYRIFNYGNENTLQYIDLNFPLNPSEQMRGLSIFQELDNPKRRVTLMVASTENIYIGDWTILRNPFTQCRYRLNGPTAVKEVTFSKGFVFVLVSYDDSENDKITVYRRKQHLDELIFGYINIEDPQESFIAADILSDQLIVSTGSTVNRYYLQYSNIWIGNPIQGSNSTLVIRSTSYNEVNSTALVSEILYFIVEEFDYNIYFVSPQESRLINTEYPFLVQQNMDYLVSGPFIKYKIEESLTSLTAASVKNYVNVGYNLRGFDTTGIIFHKIFPAIKNSEDDKEDKLWLFIQNRTMYLTAFACELDPSLSLNCKPYDSVWLAGRVKQMQVFESFIFALLNNTDLILISSTMKILNATLACGCTDIVPISRDQRDLIICMQPQLNRFAYLQFSNHEMTGIHYIDDSYFPKEVALVSVAVEQRFPGMLFINNNNSEILIVDAYILADYDEIVLVDIISPTTYGDFNFDGELRFFIIQERMIFYSSNNLSRVQEWHIGFSEPNQGTFIKTYTRHPNVTFNFDTIDGHYDSEFLPNFYISTLDEASHPEITILTVNSPGNDNFQGRIPLKSEAPNAKILLSGMPLNEMDSDLLLSSTEKSLNIFIVYNEAKLSFLSNVTDPLKTQEEREFAVHVCNDYEELQFDVTFELITFNTQTKIMKKKPDIIVPELININASTKNDSFTFPTYEYFNGTILFYNLRTKQTSDSDYVYLKSQIAFDSAYRRRDTLIKDMVKSGNYIFMQAEKGIVIVNPQTREDCLFSDSMFSGAECKLIEVDEENRITISACYLPLRAMRTVFLIAVEFKSNCTGEVISLLSTSLISADAMKLRKGLLFLLESQQSPDQKVCSRIHVWNYTTKNPEYIGYIDQLDFSQNHIDSKGFDVTTINNGWRIFMMDVTYGIRTVVFSANGFSDFSGKNLSDCDDFKRLRIPANVIWAGLAIVQQQSEEVYDMIVTAKNFNSYYLKWNLQTDQLSLLGGYYRYPNFNHEAKISVNINPHAAYFAINAFHLLEKRSIILLYNITDMLNRTSNSSADFKYRHFIDYTPFHEDNTSAEAFIVTSDDSSASQKRAWLWASAPSKTSNLGGLDREIVDSSFCLYSINDYIQIIIESAEIHSTSLYLDVGNDIGRQSIEIQINNTMLNGNARSWFAVLLVILFVALILIFAGLKLCFPKNVDSFSSPFLKAHELSESKSYQKKVSFHISSKF